MTEPNRRKFIQLLGPGCAMACVSVASLPAVLRAEPTTAVNPDSAAARGLQFTAQSERVDQRCDNCMFFSSVETAVSGKCMVFNGSMVPAGGWCTAFQVRKTP